MLATAPAVLHGESPTPLIKSLTEAMVAYQEARLLFVKKVENARALLKNEVELIPVKENYREDLNPKHIKYTLLNVYRLESTQA